MALFGKSFEESVNQAVEKVRAKFPNADVAAAVQGKTVTLRGKAPDMATKTDVMTEFNSLVETENTINQIAIAQPSAGGASQFGKMAAAPAPAATAGAASKVRIHEVAKGDTLSALAERYYGKASAYTRIFDANRDVLDDPDRIKVGQKLKIPE